MWKLEVTAWVPLAHVVSGRGVAWWSRIWTGGFRWAVLVIGLSNALFLGVKRRGIFEALELTTGYLDL